MKNHKGMFFLKALIIACLAIAAIEMAETLSEKPGYMEIEGDYGAC